MFGIFKSIFESFINNPKLLFQILILGAFCVLIDKLYPKFRGFMGEFWVKLELQKLDKSKYIVLNDIMIKDDNGTHQIDHIVLSNYGLFVIEMKNYYGLIKGKEKDYKWIQYLGKKKSSFNNPIHQNYGHIKSLSQLLGIDEKHFIPIVCFSNQAKLSVDTKSIVLQLDFINNKIRSFNEINNDFNLKEISKRILSSNIEDKKLRKEHVSAIKEKIADNKILENNMICPKCRGNLVERNGKYGKFIGCSNYPKCKYIKK